MTPLRVAFDTGPLYGPRTGVGFAVEAMHAALAARDDVALLDYLVSFRARLTPPARRLPLPALLAHRCWALGQHPRVDRWLGDAEVLHGTNSRERQIGARWLLGELIARGAVGAVSTHDMELCRLPEDLMKHVEQVHFQENVAGGEMNFDYKLRPGPVTAGNALRLMKIVGLDVPLE